MKKMHYLRQVFLLILLIVLPLQAFGQQEKIKVGVITALTGGMATIGTAVRNGIELAQSDRPELYKSIQTIYQDDQFDARQSITAYNDLKINHKVDLLLGFGSILSQAIGPLVERDHIPLINFNFEAASVVGKHFILRAMNHTDQYMQPLADYFRDDGVSEFPIVQTEINFFNSMVGSFQKALGRKGKIVEIATVSPSESDFRTIILKLRSFRDKPIGLFLLPEQLVSFLRQAHELKFEAKYFGTDLCETAASLSKDPDLLNGCLYPDNDASQDFRTRYRNKFGNEAQLTFSGSAYDIMVLVGELLKDPRNLPANNFMNALAGVKNRAGVLGQFSFSHAEDVGSFFEYPIHIKKIEGTMGISIN